MEGLHMATVYSPFLNYNMLRKDEGKNCRN